jgi:hypothetical protein
MDPITITALTTNVMAVLLPLISKGAEAFASEVGKGAYEKAKAMLTILKERWSEDNEAVDNLTRFEANPKRYEPVLSDILQEKLSTDQDLAARLSQLLQEMDVASLEIIQRIDKAEGVTGLDAEEMTGGSAKVMQEIKDAKNTIGAKIKKLG